MIYFGGLTFYAEDPKHFLKIPNAIAARRIAGSVFEKYGLLESLPTAQRDRYAQSYKGLQ